MLDWSLRKTLSAEGCNSSSRYVTEGNSRRAPCTSVVDTTTVAEFFGRGRRRPRDSVPDVDTMSSLEPYRREVVAQPPVTFGHRPLSAGRMFNPCTMTTSSLHPTSSDGKSNEGVAAIVRAKDDWLVGRATKSSPASRLSSSLQRKKRAPGLSAPMLRDLLRSHVDRTSRKRFSSAKTITGTARTAPAPTRSRDMGEDYFRSGMARGCIDADMDMEADGGRAPRDEGNISDTTNSTIPTFSGSEGGIHEGSLPYARHPVRRGGSAMKPRGGARAYPCSEEAELRGILSLDVSLNESSASIPLPVVRISRARVGNHGNGMCPG